MMTNIIRWGDRANGKAKPKNTHELVRTTKAQNFIGPEGNRCYSEAKRDNGLIIYSF